MPIRQLVTGSLLLLLGFQLSAGSTRNHNWQTGQARQIQRVLGSDHPYDGDEVYVLDAKGREHKRGLVSVLTGDVGYRK